MDLKLFAKSPGNAKQRLRTATQLEAETLTGLQIGGIRARALMNRGFEICIDLHASMLDQIHISAGRRGMDLQIALKDLVEVTGAKIVEAVRTDGS